MVEEASHRSGLERLRRPPRAPTIDGLVAALERLEETRTLGVDSVDVAVVPASRLGALASYGYAVRLRPPLGLGRTDARRRWWRRRCLWPQTLSTTP
jgi:hypothetical protein